jgi:hypothetical protein
LDRRIRHQAFHSWLKIIQAFSTDRMVAEGIEFWSLTYINACLETLFKDPPVSPKRTLDVPFGRRRHSRRLSWQSASHVSGETTQMRWRWQYAAPVIGGVRRDWRDGQMFPRTTPENAQLNKHRILGNDGAV